jgi:geranylgeranyl diphosphate synthase type II
MEFANREAQQQLAHLFSSQPTDNQEKIATVTGIFNASGASEATKKAIQEYTFKAFETLDKMDISPDKKVILKAFGESLMGRNV